MRATASAAVEGWEGADLRADPRRLPVIPALTPLLPDGGLDRGTSVAVAGPGATSLALALVAGASVAGTWVVVVGAADLGLVAAAEAGLALERTVLVTAPPPERWGTVTAALVETGEIVLARSPGRVRPGDGRRLAAHLRNRGGVLVRLPGGGPWPDPPDLTLRTRAPEWQGAVPVDRLDGAGRLRARRLVVEATGRGRAARPRRVTLWLPGADGAPAPVDETGLATRGPGAGPPAGSPERTEGMGRAEEADPAWVWAG